MRVLRRGTTGDDIVAWQHFLLGCDPTCSIDANGTFDDATFEETVKFQRKFLALVPDGVVGPRTFAVAMSLGFDPTKDTTDDECGPNWPQLPPEGPLSYASREKLFGKFSYVPAGFPTCPEAIRITDDWPKKNIVIVKIPQLAFVRNAPRSCSISVHAHIAEQFIAVFKAWDDAGLSNRIITWDGSWVPRYVRGSRSVLSNHAWGTAFDVNAQWNMLGSQPALKGSRGSVRELVQIAYDHGFYWLGWNRSTRPDGMHFEARKVL